MDVVIMQHMSERGGEKPASSSIDVPAKRRSRVERRETPSAEKWDSFQSCDAGPRR